MVLDVYDPISAERLSNGKFRWRYLGAAGEHYSAKQFKSASAATAAGRRWLAQQPLDWRP